MDAMPDLSSASTPCIDTLPDTSAGYAIPDIFQEPSLTEQPLEALDEEPAYLTWHKQQMQQRGGVHLTRVQVCINTRGARKQCTGFVLFGINLCTAKQELRSVMALLFLEFTSTFSHLW